MQTSREHVKLAGTQAPLLHKDQIQPGAWLTGVAMTFVWEVLSVDRTHVWIGKLPLTTIPCREHTFAAYGRGQVCSVCQVRKQPIAEFLPKCEEKARVHVITPSGLRMTPQPYTVYGYRLPDGTVRTAHLSGERNWDQPLPVLPTLSVIWTIPESLRTLVSGRYAESTDLDI